MDSSESFALKTDALLRHVSGANDSQDPSTI